MLTIVVKPFFHKAAEQMGLCFDNNTVLNTAVKKVKGIKWSQTNKCWYLTLSRENYHLVKSATEGLALIDESLLRLYLEKKQKVVQVKQAAGESPVLKTANLQSYAICAAIWISW